MLGELGQVQPTPHGIKFSTKSEQKGTSLVLPCAANIQLDDDKDLTWPGELGLGLDIANCCNLYVTSTVR